MITFVATAIERALDRLGVLALLAVSLAAAGAVASIG